VVQYDLKNNRSFLRRSKVDNVRMCDLFLGSSLNILGRQLTLVDYANDFTRKRLSYKTERSVCVQFVSESDNFRCIDICCITETKRHSTHVLQ